jgi:hypothetical protein
MSEPATVPLVHLDRMTDSTGLIQHAIHAIPRRESGYTTDDNARALRLCARLWSHHPDDRMLSRVSCYLSFLEYARCPGKGFHNFLSYQRGWLDAGGCGDCQGQAVLALAEVLGSRLPEGYRAVAWELIKAALPTLVELRSLRAQAYVIIAWSHLRTAGVPQARALQTVAHRAALRLIEAYERSQRPGWSWFEWQMTYANAVLPHALFAAADRWPDAPFLRVAESTFDFLVRETTTDGLFWPVGNADWYVRGEAKSLYDQQPVEASTMAEAALAAFAVRSDGHHLMTFLRASNWFDGRNGLGVALADPLTGGCYDGLQRRGVNRNQGAESTLACLWTKWLGITARQFEGSDAPHVSRSATVPLSALPTKAPADDPHPEAAALSGAVSAPRGKSDPHGE